MPTNIKKIKEKISRLGDKIKQVRANKLPIADKKQCIHFFEDFLKYCQYPDNGTYGNSSYYGSINDEQYQKEFNAILKTPLKFFHNYLVDFAQALDKIIPDTKKSKEWIGTTSAMSILELIETIEQKLCVVGAFALELGVAPINTFDVLYVTERHLSVIKSILTPYVEAIELLSKSTLRMEGNNGDEFTLEEDLAFVEKQLSALSKNESCLKYLESNWDVPNQSTEKNKTSKGKETTTQATNATTSGNTSKADIFVETKSSADKIIPQEEPALNNLGISLKNASVHSERSEKKINNLNRKGLSSITAEKLAVLLGLPQSLVMGTAIDDGGCFFDALAQAMNALKNTDLYTEKSMRMACHAFYANNKERVDEWNNKDYGGIDKGDLYYMVQYTKAEIDGFFLGKGTPTWGRSYIEGRILCEQLGLTAIHLIELTVNPENNQDIATHFLITKEGMKQVEDDEIPSYTMPIPVLVVSQKALHFVPVLPVRTDSVPQNKGKEKKEETTTQPTTTTASGNTSKTDIFVETKSPADKIIPQKDNKPAVTKKKLYIFAWEKALALSIGNPQVKQMLEDLHNDKRNTLVIITEQTNSYLIDTAFSLEGLTFIRYERITTTSSLAFDQKAINNFIASNNFAPENVQYFDSNLENLKIAKKDGYTPCLLKTKLVVLTASALLKRQGEDFIEPLVLLEDAVELLAKLKAQGIAFVISMNAAEQQKLGFDYKQLYSSLSSLNKYIPIQEILSQHKIEIRPEDIIDAAKNITQNANTADILYVHPDTCLLKEQGFNVIAVTQESIPQPPLFGLFKRPDKVKTTGYDRAFNFAKNNELVVIDWDNTLAKGVAYEEVRHRLEGLHKQGIRIAITSVTTKSSDIILALRRNLIECIEEVDIISLSKQNFSADINADITKYVKLINPDNVAMVVSYYEDNANIFPTITKIAGHLVTAREFIKDGNYDKLTKNATVGSGVAKIVGSIFTLLAAGGGFFIPLVGPAVTAGLFVVTIGLLVKGIHEIRTAVKNANLANSVGITRKNVDRAGSLDNELGKRNEERDPRYFPAPTSAFQQTSARTEFPSSVSTAAVSTAAPTPNTKQNIPYRIK